jgi:hypothetical protein
MKETEVIPDVRELSRLSDCLHASYQLNRSIIEHNSQTIMRHPNQIQIQSIPTLKSNKQSPIHNPRIDK